MKAIKWHLLLLILCFLLAACGNGSTNTSSESASASDTTVNDSADEATADSVSTDTEVVVSVDLDTSSMFTDRDLEQTWDESEAVTITLTGDSAACSDDGVSISENIVTISNEGVYVLGGTLNGMIIVDADDNDKVQLVLNDVEITCESSAAIYVRAADKVFITSASGTSNSLSSTSEYVDIDENSIDSVVFSKSDLVLNGEGTLTIYSDSGHGIVSKDDLKFTGGTYSIDAAGHAISGKDSVRISNGSFSISADNDGIHAENKDDASKGYVYISNGSFAITSTGDGISAQTVLLIEGGEFSIISGGGSTNASTAQSWTMQTMPGRGGMMETDNSSTTVSCKALKSGTSIQILDGTISLDSADDTMHSNDALTIAGVNLTIAAGDDAIHADNSVEIMGGTIEITESYEGIEGVTITISGGNISLNASDDGLNAAGGNDSSGFGGWGNDMFSSDGESCITITGGTLSVVASGDGLDSNGDLVVTGGTVYISGPTSSADAPIDYAGSAYITGGTVIAVGSSGMAQNFGSSSTQCSVMFYVNGNAGASIVLTDADGTQLISWQSEKSFSCVVISCAALTDGSSYTLSVDGSDTEFTMNGTIYSVTSSTNSRGNMSGMNGNASMGGTRRGG